jgi:threonine dehydratase
MNPLPEELRRRVRGTPVLPAHLRPWVRRTPLLPAPDLAEALGRPVWLKHEQFQETGSFKLRGAVNFLKGGGEGVVTCSSGNHGRAVAWTARALGIPATICVPRWVDPVKREAMEEAGALVRLEGESYDEAEAAALALARKEGLRFVPPFDDPEVIAGQGTLALEVLEVLGREVEGDLLIPLSGGGLAAGCVQAVEGTGLRPVGVSASRAPVMLRSLEAGEPVEVPEEETVASALSGGIGIPNRWTFPILKQAWDQGRFPVRVVEEEAIRGAMRYAALELKVLLEGGGATALAAVHSGDAFLREREGPVVVLLTGGNLAPETLIEVLRKR